MSKTVNINLYSPRWGHDDRYSVQFDQSEIFFSRGGPKEARCVQNQDGTLTWSGHNQGIGNPLLNILSDDQIYPPSPFIGAIISVWNSWKNNELTDEQLESELILLADWVNASSRRKPDSEYWTSLF